MQMSHKAVCSSAAPSKASSRWLRFVVGPLLVCVLCSLFTGELAMSTIPQSERIIPETLNKDQTTESTGYHSAGYNKVCLSISQELQKLLWVMTGENTAVVLSRPINTASIFGLQPNTPAESVSILLDNKEMAIAEKSSLPSLPNPEVLDPAWEPLIARLVADGFELSEMQLLFAGLGKNSFSPAFMAAKVRELYGVNGIGINQRPESTPVLPDNYVQPLTDFTLGSCIAFMKQHAKTLAAIEKKHGVPANVIIGLLLIETGLGRDLGNHSALRALGSMASTTTPKVLGSGGNGKQVQMVRAKSLPTTLRDKSNWAYNEVKALISYGKANSLDICKIPGSIYGAIGICQFMPSNINPYAKDGNGDGKVDVFCVTDAMYSVASYLEAHGWRGAKSDIQKHQVIKTYNKDNWYASSVLSSSKQLALAQKGKVSPNRHALAGISSRPRSASGGFLDPSLRNLRPVPASGKVKLLGNYQSLIP